jgi:hypothetical protein
MSANQVQDLLQIGAGVSAVFGIFFLAIGLFHKDEEDDARYLAPILPGVCVAAFAGYQIGKNPIFPTPLFSA